MATCSFILSTGRVSTQNIAAIASRAHPDAVVEHEGLGANYMSRKVFRRPKKYASVLGSNVPMQRKLIEIEDTISAGTPYLDVGWPAYAWLPYLAERFSNAFRFAHLVRNPFHVAASMTTFGAFTPELRRGKRFERVAIIHIGDARVQYPEFAAITGEFSPFERSLFHWLELNAFSIEQHGREGFVGVFRFEDLYGDSNPTLPTLLDRLIGKAHYDLALPPVDAVQQTLPAEIRAPNPKLVEAAIGLATRLGYSETELLDAMNVDLLNERYSANRL